MNRTCGTESAYRNGCRCRRCCDAATNADRKRRHPNPDTMRPFLRQLVAAAAERSTWADQAACKGMHPHAFFPGHGGHAILDAARKVCARCPVRAECLDAGLTENWGVWGGTSEKERVAIRRQIRRVTGAA